ncbi:MAG: DUF3047 domain-containing protein [Candidatus Omnitrophota bacterium]|nr:DUF3047 domain-containing protein [Candidatus Omnitrophota bacterium]
MKRPGIFFFTLGSLAVAVFMIAVGIFIFSLTKKPREVFKGVVLKHFTFPSPVSLDEWEEKVLTSKSTDYTVTEHAGKKSVKGASEDSASALYFKRRLSYWKEPFLSWDWKVAKFPSRKRGEALDRKDEFDFAAQVYVIFHARFFLNSKAIQYVWTEELSVGSVAASPYTKNVRLLVLESGESEVWKHEKRDIREDFHKLFGKKLEKDIVAVSFMTDSDSTDSSAEAYYTDIKIGYLEKSPQERPSAETERKKVPGEAEIKKKVSVETGVEEESLI